MNNGNCNGFQASQPNNANTPLAQFFNSNNMHNMSARPVQGPIETKPKGQVNGHKVSAPPGFNGQRPQSQMNLLNGNKETKLITPTMFAAPNQSNISNDRKPLTAEPLTKNQLLQALNYLIENDDEFMKKVHEAYIKSFRTLAS
jgi:mRNA-decapping enzyme C-terminus